MPEPEWCTYCVNGDRTVFITSGGDCWHVTSSCAGIAAGHQRNREIGLGTSPITSVRLGSPETTFRRPCSVCVGESGQTTFTGDSRAATRPGPPRSSERWTSRPEQIAIPDDQRFTTWWRTLAEACPRWALPDPHLARAAFIAGFRPDQVIELMTQRVDPDELVQLIIDGNTPDRIFTILATRD